MDPKTILAAAGIGLGIYIVTNSVLMTNAGMIYVVQNNITGDLSVHTEPGIFRRVPFFSHVTEYKQVLTATFGGSNDAIMVRFADTYTGAVPTSFRFKLPIDEERVIAMHKDFRSEKNLFRSLLKRNAMNVTIITATQYTGEEFFQGGLNQFKTKLADQLRNGIYVTQRKQVEVEQMDLAPVSSSNSNSNQLKKAKQLVWKTVPVTDQNGLPMRGENPLQRYGIDVTQVLVGDPQPEKQLDNLLIDKKRLVAARIKAVQEQETSKAQAKTEQLKKNIQRTRAVQDAQREKELAVIAELKEVEIAKEVANRQIIEQKKLQDLALIDKEKELQIARSNLEIGKAAASAAIFEAKAIKERGLADAAVLDAKYRALHRNKEIYLAEMQRDIATVLYDNLKHYTVKMPKNYVNSSGGGGGGGGSGSLMSNVDVITSFAALATMNDAVRQARKKIGQQQHQEQ
eukprot:g4331.t1